MSVGFAILIFGVPFFLLFMASVRLFSLVEGRIIEVLLGERMPRRPQRVAGQTLMEKIKEMLSDWRTWTTLVYMVAMLPLGVAYFSVVVTALAVSVSLTFAPLLQWFFEDMQINFGDGYWDWPETLLLVPVGIIALTLLLHVVRLVGQLHGKLAKHLLVKSSA